MCSDAAIADLGGQPLDLLRAAVEALRQEDVHRLPGDALGEDLVELRRLGDALDAEFSRRVGVLDSTRGYAAGGALSAAAWLRWRCRLSPAAASEQVRVARGLADLPDTGRAFADGEIGFDHAAVITRTTEEVGADVASRAEPDLLAAARRLDPRRLRLVSRHLRHAVDPDGGLDEANRQHERRYLHLSQTMDGVFYLDGRMDAEGGAVLRTALDAVGGPPASRDRRTPAQRRADALVELCRRQLDHGEVRRSGGRRPHLTICADLAALRGLPGGRAAELDWGQPIATETLRRLSCDCAMTPMVVGGQGEPLSVGRTTRSIPASIRRALEARDRRCRWPGCDVPACWTDGHHLQAWMEGGETRLVNLVCLCRRHHRAAHEEGWRLRRDADGELRATPPVGGRGRSP